MSRSEISKDIPKDAEWKDIEDHPGYEISNNGIIRSKDRYVKRGDRLQFVKGKIIRQRVFEAGYLCARFRLEGKQTIRNVHHLLAKAFIPNPDNKPQVNHINGIKTDNRLENLEWVTNSENMKHAFRTGLVKNNNRGHNQYTKKNDKITGLLPHAQVKKKCI